MLTETDGATGYGLGRPHESAADRVYTFVKERIVTGDYAGGILISEGEVSSAVQISRTPVREAFLRLAIEGLLRLYPKRGALVVPVSANEIHDVLDARLLVERHSAETVIKNGRHREVAAALRTIVDKQRRTDVPLKPQYFSELDRSFHTTFIEAAGNELLTGFYNTLRDRQLRMNTTSLLRDPDRYATILAEHAELADLIETGDVDAVHLTLTNHLAATEAALTLH
jgi:DNA-binding GntR family transcriptional regulator